MSGQLVLSTVGIKRPQEVRRRRQQPPRVADQWPRPARPAPRASDSSVAQPRRVLTPSPVIAEGEEPTQRVVSQRTTVRLDGDLARRLDGTARAAGVSAEQLALATLERALSDADGGLRVRDQRPGSRGRTTNRKLRLPHHLRERTDAIAARAKEPRLARSELINDAIRRGLPDNPRLALALVIVAATAARAPKP